MASNDQIATTLRTLADAADHEIAQHDLQTLADSLESLDDDLLRWETAAGAHYVVLTRDAEYKITAEDGCPTVHFHGADVVQSEGDWANSYEPDFDRGLHVDHETPDRLARSDL